MNYFDDANDVNTLVRQVSAQDNLAVGSVQLSKIKQIVILLFEKSQCPVDVEIFLGKVLLISQTTAF